MSPEKDKRICDKYPKLFAQRYASMQETCMCWGIETGDGWFNIIDSMCSYIQWHIDHSRKFRCAELKYNRALKKALAGNPASLIKYHAYRGSVTGHTMKWVDWDIAGGEKSFRTVPEAVKQVVFTQVKEKFGTLRLYYDGGDEFIRGLVSMATSMSSLMCEECGSPGTLSASGWISVRCPTHKISVID